MLNEIRQMQVRLRVLRKAIRAEQREQIAKIDLRNKAEELASSWLKELQPWINQNSSLAAEVLDSYKSAFQRLLKLSAPNNRKKSYIETLDLILKHFRQDLILPIQSQPDTLPSSPLLVTVVQGLADPIEDEYLKEAIECARHKLYRGAVVLGWCAAIDRIHRKIDNIGIDKFNVMSSSMASQKKGKFKRFSSPQNVGSLSELREVFDNIILRVIEGMQLIDGNQYTRLRSCFEMRCHSSHPGDAPITEFNLLSFFSDIREIVLANPSFALPAS